MRLTRQLLSVLAVSGSALVAACGGSEGPKIGPPSVVSAVSGGNATIAAGVTTPITLVTKVLDASGNAVPGVALTWSTNSGTISPAAASTDASGQSTAQWTPGTVAGAQAATATVAGVGSATFPLTINAGTLAKLKLAPDTLRFTASGQSSLLVLTAADAFDNPIPASSVATVFTTDSAAIASVSGGGTVTARGNGTTTVHAFAGAGSASTVVIVNIVPVVDPCIGAAMTLAVGESQTLTGAAADKFCVTGAQGAEFVAIPFYGTGNGGTGSGSSSFVAAPSLPITITPANTNNVAASGPPSPDRVGPQIRASVSIGAQAPVRDVAWEYRFRERVRKQFGPLIQAARLARQRRAGARLSLNISRAVVPAVNDLLRLNVDVDSACNGPKYVFAKVQAVSKHAIVVEDTSDAANGFVASDYQFFADKFDQQVWVVDSTNFGPPTDIDENGHVILFFTKAVNALTDKANTTSFVGGFFYGRDEFYKADTLGQGGPCPGSNQGELFYLLAPDPDGLTNGHPHSVSEVRSFTIGTVAHEFQHLINFGSHLWLNPVVFNNYEETFLDEGLSHIAEELNYYAATSQLPRTNIDHQAFFTDNASYLAFADPNAVRFREYLKNPDKYPPYSVLADTSLAVRGGIWSLLRYAADQRNTSVPEQQTWYNLVNPAALPSTNKGPTGMANLKATFGSDFVSRTVHDWAIANYMDDFAATSSVAAYQHPSWNTRDVETWVNTPTHQNGTTYPLKTFNLTGTFLRQLNLADGGAAYFRFGVNTGVGGGTVTSSATLPSTFSITVIRTK